MSSAPTNEPSAVICSAKGCHQDASWVLAWNNPKIHQPERRKAWVACDEHREQLARFLQARSFLRSIVPLEAWAGEELPGRPS